GRRVAAQRSWPSTVLAVWESVTATLTATGADGRGPGRAGHGQKSEATDADGRRRTKCPQLTSEDGDGVEWWIRWTLSSSEIQHAEYCPVIRDEPDESYLPGMSSPGI